jgi:hypothetical protein
MLGLLPALMMGTGWVGCIAWSAACAAGTNQAFPEGWTRHLAGALLALLGGVALLFFEGSGLRPVAVLLFLPAGLAVALVRLAPRTLKKMRSAPLVTVLVYALLVVGPYLLGSRLGAFPPVNDDFLYALRAGDVPDPLTEAEQAAAVDVVRAALQGRDLDPSQLPDRLRQVSEGRVWVTLFRPVSRARVARGMSGPAPLHEALATATTEALRTAPSRTRWAKDRDRLTFVVDLGGPEQAIRPSAWRRALRWTVGKSLPDHVKWDLLVYDAEPGVDGFIAVGPDGREGVVLPADHLIEGWLTPRSRRRRYRMDNLQTLHKKLMRRAGLPKSLKPGDVALLNVRTWSFGAPDPKSDRTVELFRGNVLLGDEVTEELLLDRIELAGRWLLSTVEEDGRFDYEYFPNKDDHGDDYNEVRHAGSVYGLFHMVHMARAEPTLAHSADDYLAAGLLALDRVYRSLGTPPGKVDSDGFVAFLEGRDGSKTNSGAAALTLLSFLERPTPDQVDDPELKAKLWTDGDDAIMRGLAETLMFMIDDEGKVYRRWSEALDELPIVEGRGWGEKLKTGEVVREPPYFPGEAMLALVRYHQLTGEERWLEGAERIGRRQIPWARKPWHVPDHWVMQALDILDQVDPDDSDEWRDGAYAMGRRYVREQFGGVGDTLRPGPAQIPPFPDYRGAYRRVQEVPRTTRAASRGEAIGGVARIAWRHGDPSEHWERSLIEGARHLMEQQYVADNSFFLPRPDEVLGAIRMGIVDMHIRIDNNQHGIVGLGNALDALRRQEAQPR